MTRLAAIAALLVMSLSGCPSPSVLDLSVVLPEGPDPLDGVERVRLRLQSPAVEEVLDVPAGGDGSFSIERTIEISGDGYNVSSVVLEGLRGSDVVARGETPPLILRPRDDAFSVLVTRAGAASTLAARWEQPTSAPAAAASAA